MRPSVWLALHLAALSGGPALAGAPGATNTSFTAPNAVDSTALAGVRGGFGYGDNLLVTLGIDRLVRINGNVVEQSSLQFGDVGKLASGAASLPADSVPGPRLIQNGQLGQMSGGALGGTFIQNTLNDQMISSQTTLRASVNTAGVVQVMNFNASLNQALNNAVVPR
jgi:hypothetical protein